ncbi:MAG: hypothetical protein Q8P25_03240 [Candidatus Curtissbacteria bacterium]|nr:hypothetical protein [Candidatus Curtissbacteria bacterium]
MSQFQSYLIIGTSADSIRKKTSDLALQNNIDISKASPDVFFLKPLKNSIAIDQIRELKAHIFQKPLAQKFKFIIIEEADSAKIEAQNSILKILEEPPTHAIIVLESRNKAGLLPTIISRVVTVKVKEDQKPLEKIVSNNNLETSLSKITQTEDPKQFLDTQIIALTEQLITNISANQPKSVYTSGLIEQYKEAKLMINQNVNPTFVLTNLIIFTNLASK